MAPRPTEVKLLAKMMDPDVSDDALALAKDMIEALDKSREDRDSWLASARTMKGGPIVTVGPFSTQTQAMKAMGKIPFADDPATTEGLGAMIHKMHPPKWLEDL